MISAACLKEEERWPAPNPGEVETQQVVIGSDYLTQSYFSLATNSLVKERACCDWDIAFSCGVDSSYVILNSANLSLVSRTGSENFTAVTDTTGMHWLWDDSSGNLKESALTNWSEEEVFILDRKSLSPQLIKFSIQQEGEDTFILHFGALDNSYAHSMTINKDRAYNFVYVSMEGEGALIDAAPPKEDWDLLFTRYTTTLSYEGEFVPDFIEEQEDTLAYSVTGALLNPNHGRAFKDKLNSFEDINSELVDESFLSEDLDVIGFDWKNYVFEDNYYEIDIDAVYIIKDADGVYYKLRFTDFYNEDNKRGYPKFEYQRL